MAKPESVTKLKNQLERYYANAHAEMLRSNKAYESDFSGLFAEENQYDIPVYRSSSARNIIDGFRNQIRITEPTVVFEAAGASKEAQSEVALMQRWGYGALARLTRSISECGFALLLRGAACQKVLVDVDKIMPSSPPTRRGSKTYNTWRDAVTASWPYIVRAVDPLTVFPAPDSDGPEMPYIVEAQERRLIEVITAYPGWPDPRAKDLPESERNDPSRSVSWAEFWSAPKFKNGELIEPGYYIVEADGAVVIDKLNPYNLVPYLFEWSGAGYHHMDGDPIHLAVGILTGVMGEIEAEVKLLTALSVQAQMHVFPTILTTEDPRKVARQFAVGPGRIVRHPPGQPPVYMQPNPPNENNMRLLEQVRTNISRLSNVALAGGREPGVQYGVQQAMQIGQALKHMTQARAALDRIGGETLNMMARMARLLDITSTITGSQEEAEPSRMVRGDDFRHYNFGVKFEAVDPAENDRAMLVGEAMRRAGDISRKTFWRTYAKHIVPDAVEEEAELLSERMMERMIEMGALDSIVLSEDAAAQMGEKQQQVEAGAEKVVQQRTDETVPEGTAANVSELENLAGIPGAMTPPRAVAEAAMMEGRPR